MEVKKWDLHHNVPTYVSAQTKVCFRYYHGETGDIRAISPAIVVHNSPTEVSGQVGRLEWVGLMGAWQGGEVL